MTDPTPSEALKVCPHNTASAGPRIPLVYGTGATQVCVACAAWRQTRVPNEPWSPPEALARAFADTGLRYPVAPDVPRPPAADAGEVRREIVAWLRRQSDLGANRGNEAGKASTKRAAFGGGSLALARAADAIESGEYRTNDNALPQAPSPTFEDGVEPVFLKGWGGCPDDVCCENPECPDHGYPALKRASFRDGIEAAAKVAEMWDHRGDIAAAIKKLGA